MKKILALVLSPLLLAAHSVEASELTIWAGQASAKSEAIPYAFNSTNNNLATAGLGNALGFGIDYSTDVRGWTLGLGFSSSKPTGSGAYDPTPGVVDTTTNVVCPVQGIEELNCFDSASINISTTVQFLDLTVGKRFKTSWATFVPYGGIRRLSFDQTLSTAYLYPLGAFGGVEQFPERSVKYSGFGPRIGISLNAPFARGRYFFAGDLAVATLSNASRDQSIVEPVTSGGLPDHTNTASSSDKIAPVTIDLTMMVGFQLRPKSNIGLGYRYQKITDVVDSRETNLGAWAPNYGSAKSALEISGFFVKVGYSF